MKLLMELFFKKTALQVKLSCAKRALHTSRIFSLHGHDEQLLLAVSKKNFYY
jgi:hypothetical protein